MIVFKKIRFRNFGSFGNYWTEIELDKSSSTLVIGLNGHGKSFALFDSITFALFGKPFRNINKPNLVNSINRKNCIVEIEFEIESKEYRVVRGISPGIFEIYENGNLINQQANSKDYQLILEENILGMSFRSFCQVVILGSTNYVPFMQLSASDRREVIEDLLDIRVFSVMNAILKDKMLDLRSLETETKQSIQVISATLDEIRNSLESLKSKDANTIKEYRARIEQHQEAVAGFNKAIEEYSKQIDELKTKTDGKHELLAELGELDKLLSSQTKNLKLLEQAIGFYEKNDHCPTCKQEIQPDFKETVTKEKASKIQLSSTVIQEIQTGIDAAKEQIKLIESLESNIRAYEKLIVQNSTAATSKTQMIRDLEEKVRSLESNKDSIIVEKEKSLEAQTIDLRNLESKLSELRVEKQYQELAAVLLKDSGIKSRIVKRHLPTINRLINYYLNKLDFFVSFNLDENFKESIKSRHRDEFLYTSFSQGEKMRIDLAILLTWREIAKQKNKVNTNLLLLDEVFDSSLDSFGVDEFIKILTMLSSWNQDTNIFVITHRTDGFNDKFVTTLRFEKKNDFTHMNVIVNQTNV